MAHQSEPQAFTKYGWLVCAWVLIVSFQYGYHISALNQIQAVLTCRKSSPSSSELGLGLPTCIPMSDATFSTVTAIFTLGGLLGSLSANVVMDRRGRKGAVRWSAVATGFGTLLMGLASSVPVLLVGRVLIGVGAGLGLCVGPIFLAEIAPSKIKGNVGVLTQLAIVLGIMITQTMGFRLATPREWRFVLLASAVLALLQFVVSPGITESPKWLERNVHEREVVKTERRLWGRDGDDAANKPDDVEDPLLPGDQEEPNEDHHRHEGTVSILQLVKAPELRKPLMIVSIIMMSQQLSGINAVLYYSNDILSKSLPDLAPFVSLGITVVNAIMTFPPIFLIERTGRKKLLTVSVIGMVFSLIAVGLGLDSGIVTLSSVAITTFVMSFAVGLGPVPFVLVPDVSPPHAVSSLSSVALSLNWIANFIVGLVFLPLRNLLAHGDSSKEGRVFFVFAVVLVVFFSAFSRVYKN